MSHPGCDIASGLNRSACGSPARRSWRNRGATPGGVKGFALLRSAAACGDTHHPSLFFFGQFNRTAIRECPS